MFLLKISDDFGEIYTPHEFFFDLKEAEKACDVLEKSGECRWVLLDDTKEDKEMPIKWCGYISLMLKAAKKASKGDKVASNDPYVKKLLEVRGITVWSITDMLKALGASEETIKKSEEFDPSKVAPEDHLKIFQQMRNDLKSGKIKIWGKDEGKKHKKRGST